MDEGVEHQTGSHRVGGEEEVVAIREAIGHGGGGDVTVDRLDDDAAVGLARYTGADSGLSTSQPLGELADACRPVRCGEPGVSIPPGAADDPREVRQLDALGIRHDEVPDTEAGEVLDEERAGATSTDDADLLPAEDLLTAIAEEASLPVVGRVGPVATARPWMERPLGPPDDPTEVQLGARATRQPDVTRNGVGGEDEKRRLEARRRGPGERGSRVRGRRSRPGRSQPCRGRRGSGRRGTRGGP